MRRMKYVKFYVLAVALIVFFLLYRSTPVALVRVPHRNIATATGYNYSIKTEYGKSIIVARVIDGDTIELVNGDRLRYIGIDTPEEVDPRKPVQCFAQEAAAANKALVEGKSIIFYKDVSSRDKYGRWLGFVYLSDGMFVNKTLVEQGFAFAYPYKPEIDRANLFKQAEMTAQGAGRGLWTACAVRRINGREQTNAL